jgi:hypothetical protein
VIHELQDAEYTTPLALFSRQSTVRVCSQRLPLAFLPS